MSNKDDATEKDLLAFSRRDVITRLKALERKVASLEGNAKKPQVTKQ